MWSTVWLLPWFIVQHHPLMMHSWLQWLHSKPVETRAGSLASTKDQRILNRTDQRTVLWWWKRGNRQETREPGQARVNCDARSGPNPEPWKSQCYSPHRHARDFKKEICTENLYCSTHPYAWIYYRVTHKNGVSKVNLTPLWEKKTWFIILHLKQQNMGLFIKPPFSTSFGCVRWKITHLARTVEKKIHFRPWLGLWDHETPPCEWISPRKQRASEFCFDVTHKDANNKNPPVLRSA